MKKPIAIIVAAFALVALAAPLTLSANAGASLFPDEGGGAGGGAGASSTAGMWSSEHLRRMRTVHFPQAIDRITAGNGAIAIMNGSWRDRGEAARRSHRYARERFQRLQDLQNRGNETYKECTNDCADTDGEQTALAAALENNGNPRVLAGVVYPSVERALYDPQTRTGGPTQLREWRRNCQIIGGSNFCRAMPAGAALFWREMLEDCHLIGQGFCTLKTALGKGGSGKLYASDLARIHGELKATPISGGGGGEMDGAAIFTPKLHNKNCPMNANEDCFKAFMIGMALRMPVMKDFVVSDASGNEKEIVIDFKSDRNKFAKKGMLATPVAFSGGPSDPEAIDHNFSNIHALANAMGAVNAGLCEFDGIFSRGDGNCPGQKKADKAVKGAGLPGITGGARCMSGNMLRGEMTRGMETTTGALSATESGTGQRAARARDASAQRRAGVEASSQNGNCAPGGNTPSMSGMSVTLLNDPTFIAMVTSREFWHMDPPPPGQRFADFVNKKFEIAWAEYDKSLPPSMFAEWRKMYDVDEPETKIAEGKRDNSGAKTGNEKLEKKVVLDLSSTTLEEFFEGAGVVSAPEGGVVIPVSFDKRDEATNKTSAALGDSKT